MDKLQVKYAVGYHGSQLHYVEKNLALGMCGNTLCCHSLSGGPNLPVLHGAGFGISVIAYSSSNDWIAYAEKGLRPSVYVHEFKTQKLIAKLSDLAELGVGSLAFSRRGYRLLTTSEEPDFRVILWDLESSEPAKLAEGQMKWSVESASFSPDTSDLICVNGMGRAAIWTYEQSFKRISFVCKTLQLSPFRPQCHAWSTNGEFIYIGGLKGEVLIVDTKAVVEVSTDDGKQGNEVSLQELLEEGLDRTVAESECRTHSWDAHKEWKYLCRIPTTERIVSICVGDFHIAVVGFEGNVAWFYVKSGNKVENLAASAAAESQQRSKSPGKKGPAKIEEPKETALPIKDITDGKREGPDALIIAELDLEVYDVVAGLYRGDGMQLLVGTADGSIVVTKLNAQLLMSLAHGFSPRASRVMQAIANVEWRMSHHDGAILGITVICGGRYIVTCGQDGTLRIWDAERTKELSRQCFQSPLTCLDSDEANSMIVVGSESGFLNMVKVDAAGRSAVIYRSRLHRSSLDKVGFNKTATHVVVLSKSDGRVFFLRNSATDVGDLELLGYAVLQDLVLAFAWDISSPHEDLFLLLSLNRGEIVKIKVPTARAPGGGLFFESKALRRISFRVAVPALSMIVGKYFLEKEGIERKVLWAMGQDKKLQQYRLPDTLQAWTGPDAMPHTPHFILPAHAKPGTALFLDPEKSLLVTGAEDGSLQIRTAVLDPMSTPLKVREIQMYDGYAGGLTCVTMARGKIYCGGFNGVIFICDLDSGTSARHISPREGSTIITNADDDDPDELSLVEKQEQNAEERSTLASQSFRTDVQKNIQELRKEFHEIFDRNEKAPELERLTRSELIVDLELEKSLRLEGVKKVVAAQEEVKLENLKKGLLAERIKTECWNTMVEPGSHLYPFIQGFQVPNFPMHVQHRSENRLAKVAKILRIVEMQEQTYIQKTKFSIAVPSDQTAAPAAIQENVPPEAHPEAPGATSNEGTDSHVDANADGDATEASDGKPEDGDEGAAKSGSDPVAPPPPVEPEEEEEAITPEMQEKGPIEALLYQAFHLTSSKRKRVQRLLLQTHLLEIRESFNKHMEECGRNKSTTIEKIKEMHARIKELQKYLGQKDDFLLPELNRTDNFKVIFEVKDDEISVPKPISEAEKLEAIQRAEEEALRLKQGGNASERALIDMMGGKLEMREEEVMVEAEIERPAWMSGNPKKFTKEQIKELKEFEAKLKTMKEEREKKIRAQEAEMRKLKVDIQDVMSAFDSSIMDLYAHRLQEEAKCVEVEQTIARLSTEIENEELRDEKKEADLARALDQLKAAKGRSVSAVTEFKREVDDFKDRYEYLIQEDKTMDRNFKKDFQDCGDVVNLLYKHFKKRKSEPKESESPRGSPRRESQRRGSSRPQQRRRSSASQRRTSLLSKPPSLDPFDEKPEDVEPEQWERLLTVRNKKIQKEEDVKKNGEVMTKMGVYLGKLAAVDDSNRKRIEKALRSFAEFKESRERKKRDMAFVLHMKQGSVEVEVEPLEGGFMDAVLLPRSIVEEFNSVILREANSKIDMLVAIKDFKRGIYDVQWEIRRLQVLQITLNERIRYIQLLRNTKALQTVLKNGEDVAAASESVALDNRLEHNMKLHEKKVAEKQAHLSQIAARTNEIRSQNLELQKQAAMIHQHYSFQHALCSKSLGDESLDAALREKITSINKKTRLRDLGKEQISRIVELNDTLNAIKVRSHPQFAN